MVTPNCKTIRQIRLVKVEVFIFYLHIVLFLLSYLLVYVGNIHPCGVYNVGIGNFSFMSYFSFYLLLNCIYVGGVCKCWVGCIWRRFLPVSSPGVISEVIGEGLQLLVFIIQLQCYTDTDKLLDLGRHEVSAEFQDFWGLM